MIVTEEEAKTKWCPDARVWTLEHPHATAWPPTHNRADLGNEGKLPPGAACLGSMCMAWRWQYGSGEPNRMGFCGRAYSVRLP